MKILNLYAGIGGNRKLWENMEVTAIENNLPIAKAYKKFFPKDRVICTDAHKYLLENYDKFDFIWSSPPCQSHGQYRYNVGVRGKGFKALFPDMKLYEEIIFLKWYFKGGWVVENTRPFYAPLITPSSTLARHYFWCNFEIPSKKFETKNIRFKNKVSSYDNLGFDILSTKIENKRQVLRNCVDSNLGLHILNAYLKSETKNANS